MAGMSPAPWLYNWELFECNSSWQRHPQFICLLNTHTHAHTRKSTLNVFGLKQRFIYLTRVNRIRWRKPSLQWFDLESICLSFCFTHKRLLHQVRKRNSIPKYSQTEWLCQLWFSVKSNEFEHSELNLTFKTSAGWICLGIFNNSCFDCIVLSIHFPTKVLRPNPAIFGSRLCEDRISLHKMLWFEIKHAHPVLT